MYYKVLARVILVSIFDLLQPRFIPLGNTVMLLILLRPADSRCWQ